MHFSVPDTQEITDKTGSTYAAYTIYVNGVFHCALRYRQLHYFNEQLKKVYGVNNVPYFPPKKLLPLNQAQLEERRLQIEKYVQILSQNSRIVSHELFSGFFLNAQQESRDARNEDVKLDIYLPSNQVVNVKVRSTDRTSLVLEAFEQELKMSCQYLPYFALYVALNPENGSKSLKLVRKLQNFESPYLTLMTMNSKLNQYHILLRTGYWDPSLDEHLMRDRIPANLLYHQVRSDIERKWIAASREERHMLKSYAAENDIDQYMDLARTLQFYGYLHFESCLCDYPEQSTLAIVSVGAKEILLRFNDGEEKEVSFKINRLRCWRLTTSTSSGEPNSKAQNRFELSFEYLIDRTNLRWITIISSQAILLSISLQHMVEELVRLKKGDTMSDETVSDTFDTDSRRASWNYIRRDGSSHHLNKMVRSASSDSGFAENGHAANGVTKGYVYDAKKGSLNGNLQLVKNRCFEDIRDEDL
ncbi:Sorting nexin-17 [Halotydeus destructor]|nr:Sorting nexin-17 [Halotydeus destructor]